MNNDYGRMLDSSPTGIIRVIHGLYGDSTVTLQEFTVHGLAEITLTQAQINSLASPLPSTQPCLCGHPHSSHDAEATMCTVLYCACCRYADAQSVREEFACDEAAFQAFVSEENRRVAASIDRCLEARHAEERRQQGSQEAQETEGKTFRPVS